MERLATYIKLEREFNKKVKELQHKCPHKRWFWSEQWWAPGHSTGNMVKICKRCNKILEVNKGKVTLQGLSKHADEFAKYRGWFKKYDGHLLTEYMKIKEARMEVKIDNFFDQFGDETKKTGAQVSRDMGMSEGTITNYKKELLKHDAIEEGVHYIVNKARKFFWLEKGIEILQNMAIEKGSHI